MGPSSGREPATVLRMQLEAPIGEAPTELAEGLAGAPGIAGRIAKATYHPHQPSLTLYVRVTLDSRTFR
jgi:hypothetical protein